MLFLPPVTLGCEEGEQTIVLPCSALDLIRLLVGRQNDRIGSVVLAENPSLLIFAACEYHQIHQTPAADFAGLSVWFQGRLDDLFQRVALDRQTGWYSFAPKKFRKQLKKLYRSSNSENFLAQIGCFLASATGLSKPFCLNALKPLLTPVLQSATIDSGSPIRKGRPLRSFWNRKAIVASWFDPRFSLNEFRQLVRLNESVDLLREQFEERLLAEKLAALKQLAYGASHEINNPLANIATRAQTLLSSEIDFERRLKLSVIYEQAIRSHEMISDLMLFANPPEPQLERLELRFFLSRLYQHSQRLFVTLKASGSPPSPNKPPERNGQASSSPAIICPAIALRIITPSDIGTLQADSTQLMVALQALIRNAAETLRESNGGTIELRVSRRNNAICFSVTDDGRGVPESIQRHLFDPFFSGREAGRGLGFGLSKAWRIAQEHSGTLTYVRTDLPGSRFDLTIPD